MGKFKIAISFDTKFLNTLKDTEKSGVEIQRRKHHLALHPIQLNHFNESIKEVLKEGVAKYSKELKGILLGYENIKLLSGGGVLHEDSCYNHFDIEADFFVFKPEVGEEMQGVVTRKSKDHVGLLVYNTFNVSIPALHEQDDWLGKCVKIGYNVLFKIVHFSFTSHLPYIKGELISILSEVESGDTSETTSSNKTKKANKKIHFGDDDSLSQELTTEESILHEGGLEFNESPKKKKSKKNKLRSSDSDNEFFFSEVIESELKDDEDLSLDISSPKKKRTKKVKLEDTVTDFESQDDGNPTSSVSSPKKKKAKKVKVEDTVSDFESKDNENLTSSVSSSKKKKTRNMKLEDSVSDFENSLNLSDTKQGKKRKNSASEMSDAPKKKKKRILYEIS